MFAKWLLLLTLLLVMPAKGSVDIIQRPSSTVQARTITFVSSGYLQKDKFLADVKTCVAALYNNSGGVLSDPWPRYIFLFNIYAVFEPSVEEGVTVPVATQCNFSQGCPAKTVNNNLDCALGYPNPYIISCSIKKVVDLALQAEVIDVVVVLVNEQVVAGVASSGIAYVTNEKNYMPYLLVHYLNRAFANLHEEYGMGFDEKETNTEHIFPNCLPANSEAISEWAYWGITPSTTGEGCTFENYVSPTSNGCLMRNLTQGLMCPICKEQLVLSFFSGGVQDHVVSGSSNSTLNVLSGRCPPGNAVVYVNRTEGLYLSVGSFGYQNDVQITWYTEEGRVITNSTTEINITNLDGWSFPTVIRVSVVDYSPMVRPSLRTASFGSTSLFSIRERTANTNCVEASQLDCFSHIKDSVPVQSMCVGAESTTASFNLSPHYEENSLPESEAPSLEPAEPGFNKGNVITAVCVSGGISFIYLLIVFTVYFTVVTKRAREILLLGKREIAILGIVLGLALIGVLFSVIAIGLVNVYTPRQFIFGWQIFVSCIVLAVIVLILQLLNVNGILFRWRVFCAVCSSLQIILSLGFNAVGIYSLWASYNRDSSFLGGTISGLWLRVEDQVKCSMEERLYCSGFNTGCFMTLSSECPDACTGNLYVNGCRVPLMRFMSNQYYTMAVFFIAFGIVLILTAIFNAVYFLLFKKLSAKGKLRRSFRNMADPPFPPITKREADALRKVYKHECDRRGVEALEGKVLIQFVEAVFDEPMAVEFVDVFNASGPVTFDELMCTYFPFVKESQDPALNSAKRNSSISLSWETLLLHHRNHNDIPDALREAVGALSPEAIHSIIQSHVFSNPLPALRVLAKEFSDAAGVCSEAYLAHFLSPMDLEALRGAWVALNPKLVGSLSGEQLEHFYYWSHDKFPPTRVQFQEWKKKLSLIKKVTSVGWSEFCYVYAKKKLLSDSLQFARTRGLSIPSGVVLKSTVVHRYGYDAVSECFLPSESEIPKVRVLKFVIENDLDDGKDIANMK